MSEFARLQHIARQERKHTLDPRHDLEHVHGDIPHPDLAPLDEEGEIVSGSLLRLLVSGVIIALVFAAVMLLAIGIWIGSMSIAWPRDDGRFSGAPLKKWFDQLASGKGLCCSFADGVKVEDVDWTVKNEGQPCEALPGEPEAPSDYCVRLEGRWWIVPQRALVLDPNRYGPAVVWPIYSGGLIGIRCFMPGAGA
jgi:hypothetical protein